MGCITVSKCHRKIARLVYLPFDDVPIDALCSTTKSIA